MRVFWAQGYEGTSLDDLSAATGLSRSSLYAAYGDKRQLYVKALDRYEAASVERVARALSGPAPVREKIQGFFDDLVGDIVKGPGRRGCFIGNCAAELAAVDKESAARVRRSLGRIEGKFLEALSRARAAGELPESEDVRAIARFITASIQGLRLVGKTGANRQALEDITRTALRALQ